MEFWGHEVKPGVTVLCEAGDGSVIHLSQAALGETKKGSENVVVFAKVGDKKLAIGTLSSDKHPQISCDLFFNDAFELSHNSKTTSVFLCGYKVQMLFESDSGEDEDEELEIDEIPVKNNETEKSAAKVPAKDGKKDKQVYDNESDDSETSSGTDESDDSETSSGTDESDDSETSSGTDSETSEDDSSDDDSGTDDSEDEETSMKPEVGKKRAVATALKTPASDKKAKISTPKKETGDKKSVHVASPHPAKQASKTPADGKQKEKAPKTPADSKAKEKSTKSGSHSCKSCGKTFNSAATLESHQKAKKHEA